MTMKATTSPRRSFLFLAAASFILCSISFQAGSLTGPLSAMHQSTAMVADTKKSDSEDTDKFELARRESLGFFDDIREDEWKLLQNKVRSVYPNTKGDPRQGSQLSSVWFQNHYEPDFACRHERRIGSLGDGGKWVCDPYRISKKKDCLVYSVGSNGDASFEAAIQKDIGQHCEIHTFDFGDYNETVVQQAPGVHYHQWGLGTKNEGNLKTLKETVRLLGHANRTIDLFKIDCEGCELTSFASWFESGAILKQILLELHSWGKGPRAPAEIQNPQTTDMFERLYKEGYVIFHKEPNLLAWGAWKCIEYAFIKMSPDFVGLGRQ